MMIEKIIPAASWIRRYRRADLKGDISAGFLVTVMLIPQSMAYAMLAGLPPVMGLYASTVPIIIYVLFGSSRHLAVGPVAMISLLVYAGCSGIAQAGSPEYLSTVLLLSFCVGALMFLLGIFRMGFLSNFISHAVVSGFTSAAAIIIAFSQLKHLLGIPLSNQESVFRLLNELAHRVGETSVPTALIGFISIAVLFALRKVIPRFPGPLLTVAGGALCVYFLGLHAKGVAVVGNVPHGLPSFSVPSMDFDAVHVLLPTVLAIVFVGYMESISVSQYVATREKYKVDPNRELVGLGLANIACAFLSALPVTGGFSRTAVNYQAGARTGLASAITAVSVILTLLFLTPLFYYLPKTVLAAIIIVAVAGLVDVKGTKELFTIKKTDGLTLLLTFIATLSLGIEWGILAGIVFSLTVFIRRSAYPRIVELGYVEKENTFRDIKRFPEAERFPNVLIVRVDASLYFANMGFVESWIREQVADSPETQWVVMDFSGVNDIDAIAIHVFNGVMDNYSEKGVTFLFAGMKGQVRDIVKRSDLQRMFGENIMYGNLKQALKKVGGTGGAAPLGLNRLKRTVNNGLESVGEY
jgi:SulP family sulfate permease